MYGARQGERASSPPPKPITMLPQTGVPTAHRPPHSGRDALPAIAGATFTSFAKGRLSTGNSDALSQPAPVASYDDEHDLLIVAIR